MFVVAEIHKSIIVRVSQGIIAEREANVLIDLSGGLTEALRWFPCKFGIKRVATVQTERNKCQYNENHLKMGAALVYTVQIVRQEEL